MKNSKKLSPPPQPGQLVRTGYAVLIKNKLSSARRWHTFGSNDEEGVILDPNENLIIPATAFEVGTRIDIYERKKIE